MRHLRYAREVKIRPEVKPITGYTEPLMRFVPRAPPALTREYKFHDATVSRVNIPILGVIFVGSFFRIEEGVKDCDRIGITTRVISLDIRFGLKVPIVSGSLGGLSDTVRIMVYHDRQMNGVLPVVSDLIRKVILEDQDYKDFRELSNTGRFSILADRFIDLNPKSGAGNGAANDFSEEIIFTTMHFKLGMDINYTGASDAIANIASNNIGMMLISRRGITDIDLTHRARFVDL